MAIWPQLQLFGQLCAGPVNGIGLIEAVVFGSAAACATGTRPGDGWQKCRPFLAFETRRSTWIWL